MVDARIDGAIDGMAMLGNLCEALGGDIISPLYP